MKGRGRYVSPTLDETVGHYRRAESEREAKIPFFEEYDVVTFKQY